MHLNIAKTPKYCLSQEAKIITKSNLVFRQGREISGPAPIYRNFILNNYSVSCHIGQFEQPCRKGGH